MGPYHRNCQRSNSTPPNSPGQEREEMQLRNVQSNIDEAFMTRCLTPINTAIRALADRQMAMEDQANSMLVEIKAVVSTLANQQDMLAGAVTQKQDTLKRAGREQKRNVASS